MANDENEEDGFYWVNKTDTSETNVKNYKESRYLHSFGTHGKKPGQFLDPLGITCSRNSICVTDPMKNCVSIFDIKSVEELSIDGRSCISTIIPKKECEFSSVFDVAFHEATNSVLVTDPVEKCIHHVSINDTTSNTPSLFNPVISLPNFDSLSGITVTNDGVIGVLDSESGRVVVCDGKGDIKHVFGREGSLDGEFCLPQFICWDKFNQRFFVADTANSRVQVFSIDGKFLFSFGEFGFKKGECCFKYPSGISTDDHGRVFVADQGLHNVQIFDRDGHWLHTIGGPGYIDGCFNSPKSLCLAGDGLIFVTDSLNCRVQYFS